MILSIRSTKVSTKWFQAKKWTEDSADRLSHMPVPPANVDPNVVWHLCIPIMGQEGCGDACCGRDAREDMCGSWHEELRTKPQEVMMTLTKSEKATQANDTITHDYNTAAFVFVF